MNVVVLGVAGFVGSNLAQRLLNDGHTVIGVDNLCTGSYENVLPLKCEQFTFFPCDIESFIPRCKERVDWVFNLASPASPAYYFDNPIQTMSSNAMGSMHTLEWARQHGAKVLYSSTSEVYGDPEHRYQEEHHLGRTPLTSNRASYEYSKKYAEVLHYQYKRIYGLDTRVIRIFNAYGPNCAESDGRVVSNFIFNALRGKPLMIHNTGRQVRSLMYIDDLVDALIELMQHETGWDGAVNIGNPTETTVEEIAKHVEEIHGPCEKLYTGGYDNDPKTRCPKVSKLVDLIGHYPSIPLHEGLRRTYEWAKERLGDKIV